MEDSIERRGNWSEGLQHGKMDVFDPNGMQIQEKYNYGKLEETISQKFTAIYY